MATTTNYGWTTPDDTSLVKDGASAIRTLGTSVDTTTKNLNPQTTLGDIAYRSSTANTNTRVGIGTSGQGLQVVAGVPSWAASSTSTLTTTGDTLYASAANTLARRAIGSTGEVLTVSGGLPTWAAPAAAIPANSSATVATSQTTTSTTYTDLATAGPAVTVTTGTKALVIVTASINPGSSSSGYAYMSYAVSGATTSAAVDTRASVFQATNGYNEESRWSAASVVTLTAGSNTFTAKYRKNTPATTPAFKDRDIFVMNLA